MTTPVERKKIRVEGDDGVAAVGDNRRAGDPDGNKTAGDSKEPGVTNPNKDIERPEPNHKGRR